MGTVSVTEQAASVPGELHYLERGSTVLRRFTAPGASINTGSYEAHTVPIRNGRPTQDSFRTDIHGFEISRHRSAVSEFTDKAEVDAVYIPEVIEFVKERTGADEVVSRGAVLRRSAAPAEHASQPQAALVHFVFHDSDHSRPWQVLHSAFRDPTVETSVPRHSIEVRTFAFFG
jgi:hypothetical protein